MAADAPNLLTREGKVPYQFEEYLSVTKDVLPPLYPHAPSWIYDDRLKKQLCSGLPGLATPGTDWLLESYTHQRKLDACWRCFTAACKASTTRYGSSEWSLIDGEGELRKENTRHRHTRARTHTHTHQATLRAEPKSTNTEPEDRKQGSGQKGKGENWMAAGTYSSENFHAFSSRNIRMICLSLSRHRHAGNI